MAERARDELARRDRRVGLAREHLGDLGFAALVGEAVTAQQQTTVHRGGQQPRVDLDAGIDAERAGEDVAMRVGEGRLGRNLASPYHLFDETVVLGEAAEAAALEEVSA